jgi:hypothetical protein
MTHSKHAETGQPDGQHHSTHPVYHFQHLISTTPLNTTRPEPYRTLQQLTHAELITTARKTIAQLARTQHPYPNHWLAVACAVGGVGVEVVAALGGGGGVSLDEERFWVGGEAVLGF